MSEGAEREALVLVHDYLSRRAPRAARALREELEELSLLGDDESPLSGETRPATVESFIGGRCVDAPRGLLLRHLERSAARPQARAAAPETAPAAGCGDAARLSDGRVTLTAAPVHSLLWPPADGDADQADAAASRLARSEHDLRVLEKELEALAFADRAAAAADARALSGGGLDGAGAAEDADAAAPADAATARALAHAAQLQRAAQVRERRRLELVAQREALGRDVSEAAHSARHGSRATQREPRNAPDVLFKRQLGRRGASRARQPCVASALLSGRLGCGRTSLSGHREYSVFSVTFDTTGEFVLTGADDFLVKVWHVPTALLAQTLRGHRGVITDIAVSPYDNATAVSASEDGSARLWRLRDGANLAVLRLTLNEPFPAVSNVCYDARRGALYCIGAALVRCWDVAALQSHSEAEPGSAAPPAVARRRGAVWDRLVQGVLLPQLRDEAVSSLAVSNPSGAWFAAGAADGAVRVWKCVDDFDGEAVIAVVEAERAQRRAIADFHLQGGQVFTAAVTAASHGIATALWRLDEMLFVAVFAGEAAGDPATDVAFSNANDRLLSASMRGCSAKILFWGRAGGGERAEAGPLAGACIDLHVTADARARARELHAAAWSCDDTLIFLSTWSERAQEQRLEIYDAFDGARLRRFQAHAGKCFGIAPHPKFPRLLLTGGHDHQVYAWDARLKGVAEHVTRDDAAARAADATGYAPRQRSGTINLPPDRDALIRQENDDDSNVPINRRAPLASDARCSADVWSCSWSPDGTVVAVADLAGQLHLYGPRDSRRAPVPREQYLSTDYSELVWDDHGYAQDIVTGVAPHLAPRAMLQMSAESSLSSVMSSRGPAASSPPPLFDVRDAPHMLPDRLFAARQQPRPLPARDVARLRAARDAQRNAVLAAVDCAAAPSRRAVQVQASRSKLLGADDCAAASAAAVLVAAGRALWPRVRDGAFHDDAYDDADGAAACVGTVTVAAPAAAAGRGGRPRAPGRAGTTPLERIRQNAAASWIDDDEPAPAENDDADDGEDADFAAPLNADDDDESSSDENGDDGDSDHGGRRRAGRRMGRDAGRTTRSSRRLTPPDGDDENVGEERVTRSRRHVGRALGGAAADGAGAADRAGRAAARRAARGNEYDDDDDDALRRTSRLRRSRSDQREEGADEANDDDDDDDEAPPPRRRAAPSRRASEEEEGDNDDDDAPSPRRASDDDDESDFGEHRPRRRGGRAAARPAAPTARSTRSRRRIVDDDEDADGRDDDDAEEEEPVPAPLAAPRPAKVDASVVVRAWACAAAPPARCDAEYQSYTPQRGDAVVYVPEGHAKYARIVGEVDAYAADGGAPPWAVDGSALKALFDAGYGTAFACRVADVEYSLPDKRQFCRSVVATLMLNLEGVPADQNNALCADFEPVAEALRKGDGVRPRATRRAAPEAPALASIRVNVRRCDAPEFVLPRWRYDEAARRTGLYAPGSQARLIFVEGDAVERYAGAVVACRFGPADGVGVPQDALHNLGAGPFVNAAACWERVDIQLVDGDLEHCSPWELEPDEEAYEWDAGPKLDAAQARRLLQVMEAVAASRDADMFRESVENTEAANISRAYLHRVPAPVDLSLMRERLLSGYYRQPEALACDAERLAHNALLYNGERSDDAQSIVATARRVAGALTRVLEPGAATDARVPTEARDCDAHRPARDADARRPAREAEARRPVRAAAAPQRRAAPPPPRSKRRRGGESDDDDDDDHGGGDDDDDDDAPPPRRRAVPSRHESDDSDDNDEPVPPPRPKRGRNAVVEEYDDEDFAPPVLAEQGRRRTRVKKAARRRTGPNLIG